MKYKLKLRLERIEKLNESYYELLFKGDDQVRIPPSKAGQFVQLLIENAGVFLRRPFSICESSVSDNSLTLLIQLLGAGTQAISKLQAGIEMDLILPLGNGFTIPNSTDFRPLLIGGGVGVAPMLYLARSLSERGYRPLILLGARHKELLVMQDHFARYGDLHLCTEDGSSGCKGFVTDHPILQSQSYNFIYSCGPLAMMKAVAAFAKTKNISCEVSLENKMACGFGTCLCCVEKTIDGNLCVCTEGPVFNTNRLTW